MPTPAPTRARSPSRPLLRRRDPRWLRPAAFGLVERGVAAGDEIGQGVARPQLGHADADARLVVFASQRLRDLDEALGHVDRVGARHRGDELVAAVADDRVERAQLGPDRGDDGNQERVAGAVALVIVDRLEPVDVDVGKNEPSVAAPGAIDLVLQRGIAHLAAQRAGEIVQVRVAQFDGGLLAIARRRGAISGRGCAVGCRSVAVLRGPRAHLGKALLRVLFRPGGGAAASSATAA